MRYFTALRDCIHGLILRQRVRPSVAQCKRQHIKGWPWHVGNKDRGQDGLTGGSIYFYTINSFERDKKWTNLGPT